MLESLYNILINAAEKLLPMGGLFGDKMRRFSKGRKDVFGQLQKKISSSDRNIWIHAASLGEFEQAVPVIERIKDEYPHYKIVVSFFSPSGYEIRKNSPLVDVVTYLPFDTKLNAKKFLDLVNPEWAFFIKYEFWPNMLLELRKREIKTLLVSGSFRKDQVFFKRYGKWMQKYLYSFHHFFVQDEKSKDLLRSIGLENVSVNGDTRFDRVSHQIEQDNSIDFIEEFKGDQLCLVVGSSWPEDEDILLDFINTSVGVKVIIAPHTIHSQRVEQLRKKITKETVLYSQKHGKNLSEKKVFIIDTIGLLSKIYSYADIAYVGGAAGTTGLHNILEPATFGVPVIIGKNYQKFSEAKQMRKLAGLFSVATSEEATAILNKLTKDKDFRQKTGFIAEHFVQSSTGATEEIMKYIHNFS